MWCVGGAEITRGSGSGGCGCCCCCCDAIEAPREAIKDQLSDYKRTRRRRRRSWKRGEKEVTTIQMLPFHSNQLKRQSLLVCLLMILAIVYLTITITSQLPACHALSLAADDETMTMMMMIPTKLANNNYNHSDNVTAVPELDSPPPPPPPPSQFDSESAPKLVEPPAAGVVTGSGDYESVAVGGVGGGAGSGPVVGGDGEGLVVGEFGASEDEEQLSGERKLAVATTSDSKLTASRNETTNGLARQHEDATTLTNANNWLNSFFSHIDKQWKFAEIILIIVISAILNLVTIVGNIMVLISFKMDRSLQTVSNYFLLSLALADLLIGLISMPLYTLYLLLNYWPLGPLMCDIWLAIDYLNSNAAVLNMLIISFDRYFSVTRPLTYRAKRTTKHACLMISFAWLLSLTIWTPAIFTYPYYNSRTVQGTDKCEIEFVKANTYLTFVTAILAFYIPVAIMIYLYWRIWLETKKRYRDLTTLFLVSGVGAAAPSRPARPIMQPPPAPPAVMAAPPPALSLQVTQPRTLNKLATATSTPQTHSSSPPPPTQLNLKLKSSLKSTPLGDNQNSLPVKQSSGASKEPPPPARVSKKSCKCTTCTTIRPANRKSSECRTCHEFYRAPASTAGQTTGCHACCCGPSSGQPLRPCCPAGSRAGLATGSQGKHHGHAHNGHVHHSKRGRGSGPAGGVSPRFNCAHASCKRAAAAAAKVEATEQQQQQQHSTGQTTTTIDNKTNGSNRSIYQLISEASSSQRAKIHPKLSNEHAPLVVNNHDDDDDDDDASDVDDDQNNLHDGDLNDGQQKSKPEVVDQDHKAASKCLVDVATSPINFNTSNQEPEVTTRPNSPQDESSYIEDFETRIVSHGDHFRFESNDPKLVACQVKPSPPPPPPQATPSPATANRRAHSHHHHAHHHHHHHHAHHHHNHKSTSSSCCCAQVISAHDAECKLCQPLRAPEQHFVGGRGRGHAHPHHSHNAHRHHSAAYVHVHAHKPKAECRKCHSAARAKPEVVVVKQIEQQVAATDDAEQQQQQRCESSASLPILSALQVTGSEQQTSKANDESSCKSYKKFSQKLTFSDILIEDREQQQRRSISPNAPATPATKLSSPLATSSSDYVQQQQQAHRNSARLRDLYDEGPAHEHPNQSSGAGWRSAWSWQAFVARWPLIEFLVPSKLRRRRNRPVRYANEQIRHATDRDDATPPESNANADPMATPKLLKTICCARPLIKRFSSNDSSARRKLRHANRSPPTTDSSNGGADGQSSGGGGDRRHAQHNSSSKSSSSANSQQQQQQQQQSSSSHPHHYHPIQPKSERKAAKTLSTLLLVFIVTWLPYNVLVLIKTLSGGEDQVPEKIWNFSYYLCYINSTINPLCYALCNAQFRRTYMRILKCKLSNEHSSTRRMVPIQSSCNWNKELRMNSTSATLECGGGSGNSQTNNSFSTQHNQPQQQQQAGAASHGRRQKTARPSDGERGR